MSASETPPRNGSPFVPLLLLGFAVALYLGWQFAVAISQRVSINRYAAQQAETTAQAAGAEAKLQAMMMDLLQLAETDADARVIARKYAVTFSPAPGAPGSPAAPGPVPAPQP